LRLPGTKSPALSFGTAMHSALETAQKLVNVEEFELSLVLNRFEAALHDEHLPMEEFERFLVHGQNIVRQLFANPEFSLQPGSLPEQRIAEIRIGQATINGKLDRLDGQGGKHLIIVDYKTGKPLSSLITKNQQQAIKAWRHRTQLVFYALLTSRSPRFSKYSSIEGQMIYVEAERAADLIRSYVPEPAEIERLAKLVEAVCQRIATLDFPDISHYSPDIKGISDFENDLLN